MTYTIWGWYDEEGDYYATRVRTLTQPVIDHPEMDGVYLRVIGEFMLNEFNIEPDSSSFTRRDLADDEGVPEEERPYTYYEMRS